MRTLCATEDKDYTWSKTGREMRKITGRDGVSFLVPKLQDPAAILGSGCVLLLCCSPSGWDTVVHQLLSSWILVFLGRIPACTGRRRLKRTLTGMQIWMCGTVAMGHTANAATLESRFGLSIYTRFLTRASVRSRAALVRKKGKVQLWGACKCSLPGQDLSSVTVQLGRPLSWLQDRRIKSCLSQLDQVSGRKKMVSKVKMSPRSWQ